MSARTPKAAPGKNPATTLLVDDDHDLLQELKEGLAHEGIRSVTATSAAEALRIFKESPAIRFVAADISMPGMDGIELINKLSAIGSRSCVGIVITGMPTMDRAIAAMRSGSVDFLQKPVTAGEIARAIRRHSHFDESEQVEQGLPQGAERSPILEALVKAGEDRSRILGQEFADEGGWQMLLALCMAHERGEAMATHSLCGAAGVPATTALRRLDVIEARGLVERFADKSDRRRVMVRLTPHGIDTMHRYLDRFNARFDLAARRGGGPAR